MTTFRQVEYEEITQQIREQEEKRKKEENKSSSHDLKVSKTMASPKDMLTDKEMECVTTVFRSFETGLRGATIFPSVSLSKQNNKQILPFRLSCRFCCAWHYMHDIRIY